MSEPKLQQIVRWREPYVSSALNAKFFGIMPIGVYKGFNLATSSQPMAVAVDHGGDGVSVALVERDGYSLTIHMSDTGTVEIPGVGEWYICIEAYYIPRGEGYQNIVAVEYPEIHHIILGKVICTEDGQIIGTDGIDVSERQDSSIAKYEEFADDINAVLSDMSTLTTSVEELNNTQAGSGSGDGNSGAVENGGTVPLPDGMSYYPGTGTLLVFWDGLKLEKGENYDESAAGEDGTANTIILNFDAYEGSKFDFIILGYSPSLGTSDGSGGTSNNSLTKLAERVSALEAETADIRTELVMPDASQTFVDELNSESNSDENKG